MQNSGMASLAFDDFDDAEVYRASLEKALDPNALNFVIDFGTASAHIKFNVDDDGFRTLLSQDASAKAERPVRWINLWSPYRQPETTKRLADAYGFSARLTAIMRTAPLPEPDTSRQSVADESMESDDLEKANTRIAVEARIAEEEHDMNHYTIANAMTNYWSVDVGERFLCVGANWMHEMSEDSQRRLWTWLILCDDGTFFSMHEGHELQNPSHTQMSAIRKHTCRVLEQLTKPGSHSDRSLGLISIRQNLPDAAWVSSVVIGNNGASNLLYYLFDDWQNSYKLIRLYGQQLGMISRGIFDAPDTRQGRGAGADLIKELYVIGRELRSTKAMHDGYDSLIKRILEYKDSITTITTPPSSSAIPVQMQCSTTAFSRRVSLDLAAAERFERLGERIRLLVLSSLSEAIAEKDALISTYFNITARRDSEATAQLSKNGAILSKLGVLFLPVSLMTAYFSVQIDDLSGVYTAKTYWVCFGVIMLLSILSLFFFQFWLLRCMELAEKAMKSAPMALQLVFGRRRSRTTKKSP